jgi:gas vesicle protein
VIPFLANTPYDVFTFKVDRRVRLQKTTFAWEKGDSPMANDHRGWQFLTGILVGTGVGAAAALLLAPQSGQETREDFRERGLELKSRARDVGEESLKRAEDLGDQARNRAEEAQARGRLVIEEQGTRLHEAIEQGKEAYEKKRDGIMARL